MKTTLSKEQQDRLERLAAKPDSEIDTSDIPEVTDWSGAMRGGRPSMRKQAVTIQLEADVIAWFREQEGERFESGISRVLRAHVLERVRRRS